MHAKSSILDLLLFLIYVNDFQNCLQKGKALMFADDTTIFQYKCLSELTFTANIQLENVNKWLIVNKLSLNITKTNYAIFHTPRCKQSTKQLNITLNNHALQRVSDGKFLGVVIHERVVIHVGSVVEWLKHRTDDQHGLGSKPTCAILLCPWERHFTALSPAWWS